MLAVTFRARWLYLHGVQMDAAGWGHRGTAEAWRWKEAGRDKKPKETGKRSTG